MSLRCQLHVDTEALIQLTVLGGRERRFEGRIKAYSAYGLRLLSPEAVALGAPMKLEWSNTLLLGEVCYCESCEGQFEIGLSLEHALFNTLELARLAQRLLDESI